MALNSDVRLRADNDSHVQRLRFPEFSSNQALNSTLDDWNLGWAPERVDPRQVATRRVKGSRRRIWVDVLEVRGMHMRAILHSQWRFRLYAIPLIMP